MRTEPFKTFRVGETLANEAERIATMLGYGSANRVIELCVEQIVSLCRTPTGARRVPTLVRLVDTATQQAPILPDEAAALNDRRQLSSTRDPLDVAAQVALQEAGLPPGTA